MSKYLYIFLFSFFFLQGFAQKYFGTQENFGKNRIQYKHFEWKTIKNNNFEFNYYLNGDKYAQLAAKITEKEYSHISDVLGYTPFTASKIFIYNNPTDLAQSNIGLSASTEYLDGSALNLAKSRIQLAYNTNDSIFKKELIKQITRLYVYDMLYGGSLKESLQNSLLLNVPEWYIAGIAAYIANDNAADLEQMKMVVLRNSNQKIMALAGKDAEIMGQAIWYYIAQRYGQDNIANILNLTRIIRAEEASIASTLGLPYNQFIKEMHAFYTSNAVYDKYDKVEENSKEALNKPLLISQEPERLKLRTGEIDTDNYIFDSLNISKVVAVETQKTNENKQSWNSPRVISKRDNQKIKGPVAYQNMLISNDTKSEIIIDPVRKWGLNTTFKLNDLLENNSMKAGIFICPNLRNHDIFMQYDKLDRLIDLSFRFDRRSIDFGELQSNSTYLFSPLKLSLSPNSLYNLERRLQMNKFTATAAYPISTNMRVSVSPFFSSAVDYDVANISKNNYRSTFLGYQLAAVFDNTSLVFNKSLIGSRAKIQLENYYGLTAADGFGRLTIDARHYQKVLNTMILAIRVSYGRSFGNSPKMTLLGGAENWINRSTNETKTEGSTIPTDLRGILFYDFPGNLRGFELGRIYGTSHLLSNIELRLPMAQYFPKGSLSSNFLRNLEFVGFSDIGSAWIGNNGPFSRQNSLNTEIIGGNNNPFKAVVTNFKNPFLVGYGFGVRTTILGYFLKFDYAWGIEDKVQNKAKTYFTLGHDF